MAKPRESVLITVLDDKKINLEAISAQLLEERKEIIRKFEMQYIMDERRVLRQNIVDRNYVDSSRYLGELMNEKRVGKGIYYYPNGDAYLGDWSEDTFHGVGCYVFANGERYEGELREGRKTGRGSYFYINGNRYEGQ